MIIITKLNEIAKINGLNLKKISEQTNIPYTSILYLNKTDYSEWNEKYKIILAKYFNLSMEDFFNYMNEPILLPFIKWVGGKRQLLPELVKYVPKKFNTYYEPFIGGGALLFKIKPKNALINDFNEELIIAWNAVQNNINELMNYLIHYQKEDCKDFYLNVRKMDRTGEILKMDPVERAARFIYLNKSGYNGLWRVNQKGQNNVPYGYHKKINLVPDFLINDANYLNKNNIKITNDDYIEITKEIKKDDFVYFDPPYIPLNLTSNFTSYTKKGFGLIQQKELASVAEKLSRKGVKVMLSNADVPLIYELYNSKIFKFHKVKANRVLNSNSSKRGKVNEVIITNY